MYILLGMLSFCPSASAQVASPDTLTAEQDSLPQVTPERRAFEAAQSAYERYFMQKINPTSDKEELYGALLESFTEYMKCLKALDDAEQGEVKEKMRRLRPEFEEAGIYFSSNGDNKTAAQYLECYLNIPRLPFFAGERFTNNANYSAYVFTVAAEMHNARDFENAVSYLQEYIELGEKRYQQTCYKFLAKDLDLLERLDDENSVLEEGIMNYPNDLELLKQAIMLNTRRNNQDRALEMLNKALAVAPNDPNLLLFKASIDDQNGRFAEALPVFRTFHEQMPNDLQLATQLALCHYNYAGQLTNESNLATDAEQFKKLRGDAKANYEQAIAILEPLSKNEELVKNDQRITYALVDALIQTGRTAEANLVQQKVQNAPTQLSQAAVKNLKGTPNFNEWYQPKLKKILDEWEQRGEFESTSKYQKRVNPEKRKVLIAQSRNKLEQEFISEYSHNYNLKELTLKPYDPDHETFRIQTRQGDLYIRVPLENEEAVKFKESWNGVKIENPQFKVDKSGQIRLVAAMFSTPYGKNYDYNANAQLEYQRVKIARPEWNDDDLLADLGDDSSFEERPQTVSTVQEEAINVGESSVDVNVPRNKDINENTFALIIANEKYKNVEDVPFALNDGRSFKRYCRDVLGVPERNIVHLENGTVGEMTGAIDRIKDFEIAYEGMKLLVYYSGHGVPDPRTNEAFLLPSDASPSNMSTGYKLSRFYSELTANKPQSVTVFLDACFSGAKKDGKVMDQAARGVIQEAREETPTANMVVFSACTGSQTAYPYDNQKHGLFTFFLLKKLQEDKGKTTYKRLKEYIVTHVRQNSLRLYSKIQQPTTQSALPESEWGNWRLDK